MTAEERETVKFKLQECIQNVLKYEELLAIRVSVCIVCMSAISPDESVHECECVYCMYGWV